MQRADADAGEGRDLFDGVGHRGSFSCGTSGTSAIAATKDIVGDHVT
jgi:hypothetical protein